MSASEQIDQYIAELGDWRGQMLVKLRALVHVADPNVTEEWKWGTPIFSDKGMVCGLAAFKAHVKFNFFKGASVEDSAHLFNAGLDAKTSRSIDFCEADSLDEHALTDLVRRAVALNQGKR